MQPPGDYIDALAFHGRKYIIEGPLPGVLLVPAVAFFGLQTNQTLLSFCSARSPPAQVGTRAPPRRPMALAHRSHAVPAARDRSVLLRIPRRRVVPRARRIGALHAAGVDRDRRQTPRMAGRVVGALRHRVPLFARPRASGLRVPARRRGPAASASQTLDFVRDRRAGRWRPVGELQPRALGHLVRHRIHGVVSPRPSRLTDRLAVSPRVLPMQLWAFFVLPPDRLAGWPYLAPSRMGLALTFTSPALILAFFWLGGRCGWSWRCGSRRSSPPHRTSCTTSSVSCSSELRHALDFEPFLFALMCLSATRGLRWWGVVLCV